MEFVFKPITKKELQEYLESAKVFNVSEEEFVNHKIILSSFEDPVLGSAKQVFDVAIFEDNEWKLLNVKELDGFTEIPMTSVLADYITVSGRCSVKKAMVIVRTMSSMLFDKTHTNAVSSIFNVVDSKYNEVLKDVVLMGKLARYKIYLDGSEMEKIKSIDTDSVFSAKYDVQYMENKLQSKLLGE